MIRLAILGSTRGSHLKSIIQAISVENLAAEIAIVLSNKADTGILHLAKTNQLKNMFLEPSGLTREAYDDLVSAQISQSQADLIVLLGYMRILSEKFVKRWQGKIINVHPSLLPAYAGMMDLAVHQAVINNGDRETGCTVHEVTAEVDAGPVILQSRCEVLPGDTADSLKQRVQRLEKKALIESIKLQIIEL